MAVSMTVTPEPNHVPPRVRIDVDTGDDAVLLTSLKITRGGVEVRAEPYTGGRQATAYDYEAPFGVPIAYRVEGLSSTYTTAYSTGAWPNTSGWTVTHGPVSTTARPGYLWAQNGGRLTRPPLPTARRIAIAPNATPETSGLWRLRVGRVVLAAFPSEGVLLGFIGGGPTVTVPWTIGPASVSWTDDLLTISTWQGQASAPPVGEPEPLVDTELEFFNGVIVPPFEVFDPTISSFVRTANTRLDVTEAWLIHPAQPSKSISIDPGAGRWRDDGLNVDRGTGQETQRAAQRSLHQPYKRRRPVVIVTGPRLAGTWALVLYARTLPLRNQVLDILDDQAPLLLRSPAGWPWDLPDGWYSIDDVIEARPREALTFQDRRLTLPLTPVDAPVPSLASLRTYADVLVQNDTYASLRAGYERYLDVLTGDAL